MNDRYEVTNGSGEADNPVIFGYAASSEYMIIEPITVARSTPIMIARHKVFLEFIPFSEKNRPLPYASNVRNPETPLPVLFLQSQSVKKMDLEIQ